MGCLGSDAWLGWQTKAEESRGPKKLSDVKVNPSIAASLGQLPVPAAKTSNGTAPASQTTAAPSATDLLLELDAPATAPGDPHRPMMFWLPFYCDSCFLTFEAQHFGL